MLEDSAEIQPSLFDGVTADDAENDFEEQRQRLRRQVATRQLDTLQARVGFILSQFSETRNSDITLQIWYWRVFQRELLSGDVVALVVLYELERLTSLARARATIQNDYKLYLPTSEKVLRKRRQLTEEQRQRYKPIDLDIPSVSVFADESGKNQDFLVVGSVWIMVPSEEYRLFRKVQEWKEEHKVTHELKFNKISKSNLDLYRDFIERFIIEEGLFGFKAIAMRSAGIADESSALADLFYFLLRRGIEHEHSTGRAPLPRRLTFIKDYEEEGYDDRLLALVVDRLENAAQAIFDEELVLESAYSEDSKGIIPLQIADLFTGCVNRVLNNPAPERGWKDEFAEEVLSRLGIAYGLDIDDTINDRAVRLSLKSPTLSTSVERNAT